MRLGFRSGFRVSDFSLGFRVSRVRLGFRVFSFPLGFRVFLLPFLSWASSTNLPKQGHDAQPQEARAPET